MLPPLNLIVTGLSVARGGRLLFEAVDFTLSPGKALLLTGPNGAGKSTLIRALMGLVRRESGLVELGDADFGENCHYLGHRDGLKGALTVIENLRFWIDFLGGSGDAEAALDAVDLLDLADLPAGVLSAGQRRRLAIARLVAIKRPIWLLDEPTAALDMASEGRLMDLIETHRADGGSVLAATHLPLNLKEVERLDLGDYRPTEKAA